MSLHRHAILALGLAGLVGCPNPGNGTGDDDDVVANFDPVPIGAFVITEIQANPETSRPEFIEVFNNTDDVHTLRGCQVATRGAGENEFVITGEADVGPGDYALLGDAEFLGGEGELPALVVWGDAINIAQTDPTETVELACPDDAGGRSLTDVVSFDPVLGWVPRKGHSWQLRAENLDATLNDNPDSWCEAPTQENTNYASVNGAPEYGSPGGPTICEQLGGDAPSAEGDLVIVEIAVDPCTGTREWFEIHNPGTETVDMRRCQIVDEPVDGSTEADIHVLDAERGNTVIPPGGVLVLNSSPASDVTFDITPDASVQGDYPWANGISFKNSDLQTLFIECPTEGGGTVEIDRINYDWGEQGQGFKGRTLSLDPAFWDAEGNDSFDSWCLTEGTPYYSGKECSDVGTPGVANSACPVPPPPPAAGDVVFTEFLALSQSAIGNNEEWFEVKNVGTTTVGLEGCTLEIDDGEDIDEHEISFPLGVTVDPGDYFVMVKSSASDTIDDCLLPWDYTYGTNLNFSNSAAQTLRLKCPGATDDVVVDELSYQFDGDDPRGIAWQLVAGAEDAVSNDDPSNWCFPEPTAAWTWSCTVDEESNYGTPGAPSVACPVEPPPPQ
ncbi:MAG: lamin tail domain-containing protein [Deltaproteobacteria bacterium]|nr:lamin tail domain-containing protein [Deltaproteobacteria bacterium]